MDVTYEFPKMPFPGKHLGFVAILEEVPHTLISLVEIKAVTGQETLHQRSQIPLRATNQEVKMVGH